MQQPRGLPMHPHCALARSLPLGITRYVAEETNGRRRGFGLPVVVRFVGMLFYNSFRCVV